MKPLAFFALSTLAAFSAAQVTTKTIVARKAGYYEAKASHAVFATTPLGKLANLTLASDANRAIAQFKRESAGMDKPRYPYSFQQSNEVVFYSADLISVLTQIFWDTAGAHPNTSYTTQNFALVNGVPKRIGMTNLLKPGIRPVQIDDLVIAKLRDLGASEVVDNNVMGLNAQQRDRFTISQKGLHFIFPPYDMGYYAQGAFEVDLTWAQLSPFIDTKGILKGVAR
ncbi:MAG: DUF3298 domain-containing protein [Chthonomonas sp.]|nr:DUF3298 domain-containing protein [Chthonomonas sp.]